MEGTKKLHIIVGTRPNFIKITQFKKLGKGFPNLDIRIIHTGQHFDEKMSDIFFRQFQIEPDYSVSLTSKTSVSQIAEMMCKLEQIFIEDKPDLVMVVGDVNSTVAGALVANKLGKPLIHLESGLRSRDVTMPEEWNRIITDRLAEILFVTEASGYSNLIDEGKPEKNVIFVGNTMIDTLVAFDNEIDNDNILERLNLTKDGFILMTMHRPATVDTLEGLKKLLDLLEHLSSRWQVIFPIHPRTIKQITQLQLDARLKSLQNVTITEPMAYFSFQKLVKNCKLIITDSGGIQEEATFRKVPCLTLRPNTERPSTVTIGTNTLISFNPAEVCRYVDSIYNGSYKEGRIPPLWDGLATKRILEYISA